jgi:endonuclease/exonuclease/phosphatase family metal-dependent hydrolase
LNLARIAEVIQTQEADIVALQEVDRFWARSGTTDQPEFLSRALGMHSCYGANLDHAADRHADVPHQYGTLILSRYPILECVNTHLPLITPTREQRGLLQALLNVRGVPLWVDNTHLDASVAAERAVEVDRIVELLAAQTGPKVLMGDLNARPTAAEIQPLFTAAELLDTWAVKGTGPGFTYPALPTRGPDRRIDYVLASPDVAVTGVEVAISPLTALAADHYPLAADVALPGSEVGIGRKR